MTYFTWALIFGLVAAFAYLSTRMARQSSQENLGDAGLAILEFGRAFPGEAIRSLHSTADGRAVFVRLHDNKAGLMRIVGHHYSCHLIEPGTVRVRPSGNGLGFAIEFLDAPSYNGSFTFARPEEAAEVSLWLLGNYVTRSDIDPAASPAG